MSIRRLRVEALPWPGVTATPVSDFFSAYRKLRELRDFLVPRESLALPSASAARNEVSPMHDDTVNLGLAYAQPFGSYWPTFPKENLPYVADGRLDVHVVAAKHATIAVVTVGGVRYDGTAKRAPGDTVNPDAAARLATARALEHAARQLRAESGLQPYDHTADDEQATTEALADLARAMLRRAFRSRPIDTDSADEDDLEERVDRIVAPLLDDCPPELPVDRAPITPTADPITVGVDTSPETMIGQPAGVESVVAGLLER